MLLVGCIVLPIRFVISENPLALAVISSLSILLGVTVCCTLLFFSKLQACVAGHGDAAFAPGTAVGGTAAPGTKYTAAPTAAAGGAGAGGGNAASPKPAGGIKTTRVAPAPPTFHPNSPNAGGMPSQNDEVAAHSHATPPTNEVLHLSNPMSSVGDENGNLSTVQS
jgi:hypothetical protein